MPPTSTLTKIAPLRPPRPSAMIMVYGVTGAGKDHFALDKTPGPVAVSNFDQGLKYMVDKFLRAKKDIRVGGMPQTAAQAKQNYPIFRIPALPLNHTLEDMRKACLPVWDAFRYQVDEVLRDPSIRTWVVDTACVSGMFGVGKCALIGTASKAEPDEDPWNRNLGELKKQIREIALKARDTDKNVIFLARASQVWDGGKPKSPEEWKPDNCGPLPYETDFNLNLQLGSFRGKPMRSGLITKSRMEGDDIVGTRFEQEELTFPRVLAKCTGMDVEDWEE